MHTGRGLAGPDGPENRHAGIEAPRRDREPVGGGALDGFDRVMHLADDDRRAVRRGRQRPAGKAGAEPHTDAHPGEPDPGCTDEQLAGEKGDDARRDVVPRDDGGVHVRGVDPHEDRDGIGLGERARPRPGARGAHAADDENGADEPVNHRAARRPSRARLGGRRSLPAGILSDGSDSPRGGGEVWHRALFPVWPPPRRRAAPAAQKGGSLPSCPSPLARLGSDGRGRTTRTATGKHGRGGCGTPRLCFCGTSPFVGATLCVTPAVTPIVTPDRSRRRRTRARLTLPPQD